MLLHAINTNNLNLFTPSEPDQTLIGLGLSNWIIFRDKFKMKLHKTTGARGFHLRYIVDDTIKTVTSPEQPLVEVDIIDINDDEAYTTSSTHFGRGFKSNNKAVWDLLKINLMVFLHTTILADMIPNLTDVRLGYR